MRESKRKNMVNSYYRKDLLNNKLIKEENGDLWGWFIGITDIPSSHTVSVNLLPQYTTDTFTPVSLLTIRWDKCLIKIPIPPHFIPNIGYSVVKNAICISIVFFGKYQWKILFVAMPSNGGNILCLPSLEIFR